MALAHHPDAVVGWLGVGESDDLAGHAFLIGGQIALTCAHVVRDHLGLDPAELAEAPARPLCIRLRKLDRIVTARVLAKGWFPPRVPGAPRNSRLVDIAVLRLDEVVADVTPPKLAPRPPEDGHAGKAYGAEEGYQEAGQEALVSFGGNTDAWGRHPLRGDAAGFPVAPGFSGGPAMDRTGAIVWGMVTTVDAQGRRVAQAIAAEYLQQALELAGVESAVRFADRVDEQAAEALAASLAAFEARLAEAEAARATSDRRAAELAEVVDALKAGARNPETSAEGSAALAGLAANEPAAAAEFFREQIRKGKELSDQGRRDAALASRQLGQLLSLSNVSEAAAAFREAVALDPADRDSWFSLGEQERTLGSLDRAAAAYDQANELPADENDPLTIWPLLRLGDVRRDQGDLAGALDAFQKSLDIRQPLAARDPDNAEWLRDLSVSHERIGDVRRDQGDLAGALDAFQKDLDIAQRLAARDPDNAGWQRDLSVSHNKIGDVRRDQGDLAGALDAFQKDLDIAQRFAARDPDNAGWQLDLSVSHERIGDVRRDQGDLAGALDAFQKSLGIRQRLAGRDPDNAEWLRDLSVSHDKIGDVRRDQGDRAGALDAFQKSLGIRQPLAARDPANAGWQRDLSVSHEKIGNIRRDQGDLAGALNSYKKAVAISERLARLDPTNAIWQKDVEVDRARIAGIKKQQRR